MAVLVPRYDATAAAITLGSASSFAVLGGAGITFAGSGPTTITGDIGTFPTLSITGTANLILDGMNYAGSAPTQAAKSDLATAYAAAGGRPYDATYAGGFDLTGLTLASGVYNDASSLFLTGTVTLDAKGDPNAVWIFQTGTTLITASASQVALINGAQANNIYWQVGSSATLGTGANFEGNILAQDDITLNTGVTVDGRLLTIGGAVTLDNDAIDVPEGRTYLLFGIGMATVLAFKRRFLTCVTLACVKPHSGQT